MNRTSSFPKSVLHYVLDKVQKEKQVAINGHCSTRAITRGDLVLKGHTQNNQSTFINDASRLWNNAPSTIKQCKTIYSAKTEIKKFVMSLPL